MVTIHRVIDEPILRPDSTVKVNTCGTMHIGELAKRSGISERMLRYYESRGVLSPRRSRAGYRQYSEADLRQAMLVRQLNEAGLKLDSVAVLLPCLVDDGPRFDPCDRVRATLANELTALDRKLDELQQSRALLARLVDQVENA
ncbi:Transcriptional regulator, MerR family protein [Salinisphaera sp. S4-8]|uniref:MerR family transcriptional regulator n=1 Tax=Salinisphaera sp. S4-8 TaxID=633357 RepID=UPI00333E66F6